jgi:hypothetical protein
LASIDRRVLGGFHETPHATILITKHLGLIGAVAVQMLFLLDEPLDRWCRKPGMRLPGSISGFMRVRSWCPTGVHP